MFGNHGLLRNQKPIESVPAEPKGRILMSEEEDSKFANSVVDFAASSRSWGSVGKLGLESNSK